MPFDRALLRLRGPLVARVWACWAIVVSVGLSSCGGRAADGGVVFETDPPDESDPNVDPSPDEEPAIAGPVRETCEDNPLLAGCPYAGTGVDSSPSPTDVSEPFPDEEPLYIAAARNILLSNCGACHGSALTRRQALGSINYIDDWDQLIAFGLITRCSPARSRVIEVMRTGEMPPAASGQSPVTDADIDFVAQAIALDCGN